ncbi:MULTISPECIES: threonine aldolase family protein [Ramlibacter]|uniref:Low specificity L-threonine aldolase n=1 Tax=Ramlibacter pinisoli TaxID=2682844 RepID=A0A6N8IV26_9BURK|nr:MULTISPECIES: beta-eliminating lyase-related protein [Ramlibacter]MBA2965025.1 low specificity L-threonine aldolase [Ramlibacter sp. CGMCC 1.13660]MVQ29990.1 low specificity L-threonine aldolase [Ramlibacter pinisoli]
MWLRSDNTAGVDPQVLAALAACNEGDMPGYGDDEHSRRLDGEFGALFEHDVRVFPVVSGTAANALSLSHLAGPLGLVACHEDAHPLRNEAGATGFFSGGAGFLPVSGAHGRMDVTALTAALDGLAGGSHGALRAAAVTVTQLTEAGTAYDLPTLRAIGVVARERSLPLHMDGARFANAMAALRASPADVTWRSGVDVLSFGGTKNGTMSCDAVVFFDPARADLFEQRLKRGGHLLSKSRFMAAQLLACIASGRWLANASHANAMAREVADTVERVDGGALLHPVDGNIVFAALPEPAIDKLGAAGIALRGKGRLADGRRTFRLVASFATAASEIARFRAALAG